MGKRLLALLLIVGLTVGVSGSRPLTVLAEEEVYRAKVVRTAAYGFNYYVVFEYKGQEYRSDERDSLFNTHMWNFISPEDKEKVARNYSFGINFRNAQFGACSAEIAQFGNDITGWTQAGEMWKDQMAQKNYPELNNFFAAGVEELNVGGMTLPQAKGRLVSIGTQAQKSPNYAKVQMLIKEIEAEYAEGQRICAKLNKEKIIQIGNAFKGGAQLIIKDIIIDNVLVPNLTLGAGSAVAEGINLMKDLAGQMYDKLAEEPTAGEIVTLMQQMVDKLEAIGNAYKASIEEKLGQIGPLLDDLEREDAENKQTQEEEIRTKKTEIEDILNETVVWSGESQVVEIPIIHADMPQYVNNPDQFQMDFEEYKRQTLAAADELKAEYDEIRNSILEKKHNIYLEHLGFDDSNWLGGHPTVEEKIDANNFKSDVFIHNESVYPGIRINVKAFINPRDYFYTNTSYTHAKQLLAQEGLEFLNKQEARINRLKDYIEAVEAFMGDEEIKNSLVSWVPKFNGLKHAYQTYTGMDIYYHGDGLPRNFEDYQEAMSKMLKTGNDDDYTLLKRLENDKSLAEANMNNFEADAANFESSLQADFTGGGAGASYSILKNNLHTSATDLLATYNALQALYASPYITLIDGAPRVNESYIQGLLSGADPAEGESVKQGIRSDLQGLREQELSLTDTFDANLNNLRFAVGELDSRLSLFSGGACKNLSQLIGGEIINSRQYLTDHENNPQSLINQLYEGRTKVKQADIISVLEKIEGRSTIYYSTMMVADNIEINVDALRLMSKEDFEAAVQLWRQRLATAILGYGGLDSLQVSKARSEYERANGQLTALEVERLSGNEPVLVQGMIPILSDGMNAESLGVERGKTYQLKVIFSPSNATDKGLVFSSNNPKVATVDANGLVSTHVNGMAIITITSADGRVKAYSNMRVGTGIEESQDEEILGIEGPQEIMIPKPGQPAIETAYVAQFTTSAGIELTNLTWSLARPYEGVTLTDGVLSVSSHTEMGELILVVRSNNDPSIYTELSIYLNSWALTDISIKEQPSKLKYQAGESIDLDGLIVTLTYADGSKVDVSQGDFVTKGIETDPQKGTVLNTSNHHGKQIMINFQGKTVKTNELAVAEKWEDETYTEKDGKNSPSSGGSSSVDKPSKAKETKTTIANGTANIDVAQSEIADTIKNAQAEAKKKGSKDGVSVSIKVDTKNTNVNNISVNLTKETVDDLVKAGVKELSINNDLAIISLDIETLKAIQKQVKTDIKISEKKVDYNTLTPEIRAIVGNHPVFDFSITGSNGEKVTNFGKGKVSISIPYTLGADEKVENLVVYFIDDEGEIQEIPNSVYDAKSKTLNFITDHFSKFAVGYKKDAVVFTDIENHWAKGDIDFVTARKLFVGTGDNKFSPDMSMTRGMFVTVLGRLAQADKNNYKESRFKDVKSDAYYMPYTEWARQNNIVNDISATEFAPEQSITREQMAVIMVNYSKSTEFKLLEVKEESIFADNEKISNYAKASVKQMQMSGIISGKDDNKFDPQGTATRAEVSAVLKRFIGVVEK